MSKGYEKQERGTHREKRMKKTNECEVMGTERVKENGKMENIQTVFYLISMSW